MPLDPPTPYDRRDGNLTMLIFAGIGTAYVIVALIQSYYLSVQTHGSNIQGTIGNRFVASVLPLWIVAVVARSFQVWRIRSSRQRFAAGVSLTFGAALARAGLQILLGIYVQPDTSTVGFEILAGTLIFSLALVTAIFIARRQRAEREIISEWQLARHDALEAMDALRHEEHRVHQNVSEALHGTVQQRFVLLEAHINSVLETEDFITVADDEVRTQLETIRDELTTMRDETIRATSRLLSPDGLELGLRPAVRIILGRLPAAIAHEFDVDEATKTLDDLVQPELTQSQRLVCLRFVEEAVTNALKHGHAMWIGVSMRTVEHPETGERELTVSVANDGELWRNSGDGTGLSHLRRRAAIEGGAVMVDNSGGQTCVRLVMPIAPAVIVDEFSVD